jgi:hypothetical protein
MGPSASQGFGGMPSSVRFHCVALVKAYVSAERRILQELHGISSQKSALFILTAVKK